MFTFTNAHGRSYVSSEQSRFDVVVGAVDHEHRGAVGGRGDDLLALEVGGDEDVGRQAQRGPGGRRRAGQVARRGAGERLVAELDGLGGGHRHDPVLERVRRVRRLGLDVELALEPELGRQPVGPDQRRAPHREARARAAPPAGSRRTATASAARPRRGRATRAPTRPSRTSSGPKQRSHANSASSGYMAPHPLQARWLAFMIDPLRSGRRLGERPFPHRPGSSDPAGFGTFPS